MSIIDFVAERRLNARFNHSPIIWTIGQPPASQWRTARGQPLHVPAFPHRAPQFCVARRLWSIHREQVPRSRRDRIHPKPQATPPGKDIQGGVSLTAGTPRYRLRQTRFVGLMISLTVHFPSRKNMVSTNKDVMNRICQFQWNRFLPPFVIHLL